LTQTQSNTQSTFELAVLAANLAESKKAMDVVILDTGTVSYLADYFVICSGESTAQIRAITDEIDRAFKRMGYNRMGVEQDKSNRWCLLDYGDIIVHVMHPQERQFYQLEHFWSHANVLTPTHWAQRLSEAS